MQDRVQIKFGGFGPATTSFSRSLKFVGDRLEAKFGDRVDIKYVWNIMDLGYRGEDILWLVESGLLTVGYQSSSYLTDRVPELGFVDLPFLFRNNDEARGAIDGALGRLLTEKIEDRVNYRILGYFENGFRQISNRLRLVHNPSDLTGMKIRVLPSDVQARTFELLGAVPMKLDLTEAIAGVVDGSLDAQENPLANTVTYGVHKFHPYHTLSNHFYISRPIFAHRDSVDAWPEDIRSAMYDLTAQAVTFQRDLAEEEARSSYDTIEKEGGEFVELSDSESAAFVAAVKPQHDDARATYSNELFEIIGR